MRNIPSTVSRETSLQIERFVGLLQKWNAHINLISKKISTEQIWMDHVLDCLQLEKYIPEKRSHIIDVGSGAGFPGIIMAILGYQNCTMVEIISKKATFLKTACLELGLENKVENRDIRKYYKEDIEYIVSRAVTSAAELLDMTAHLITTRTKVILLKSKNQMSELEEVEKKWNYELQEFQNIYKTEGVILIIKNLSPKCNKA